MKEGLDQAMLPKSQSRDQSWGSPFLCSIWGAEAVAPGMCADPKGVKEAAVPMASSSLNSRSSHLTALALLSCCTVAEPPCQ